jgi:hypothetical protein
MIGLTPEEALDEAAAACAATSAITTKEISHA